MRAISIPNPCMRKSTSMEKVATGFYCDECSKVVIDFRGKSTEEILNSIRTSTEQPCGVFSRSHVSTSRRYSVQIIRFAAALLLVFGTVLFQSCGDDEIVGRLCDTSAQSRYADSLAKNYLDSIQNADSERIADSAAKAETIP